MKYSSALPVIAAVLAAFCIKRSVSQTSECFVCVCVLERFDPNFVCESLSQ